TFLEFIETNKKDIQKIDRLDRLVSELYIEQIHDLDKKSIDILKSYILLVFGKNVQELLSNDVLHGLQKEIHNFLKFKLFELEREYSKDNK
ncbi:MAG: transcriptional regulator, partial [Clostridium celatum]|nr:transcriptional regulator [Clostridium celatum]